MQMYTENKELITESKESSGTDFSWNEYSYYHDYFIQLLSYDRKHNYTRNNIWDFSYV